MNDVSEVPQQPMTTSVQSVGEEGSGSKTKLVIIVAVVLVLISALGAGAYFWFTSAPKPVEMTDTTLEATPAPKIKAQLWDDPAGFTFEYPEDATVDKHDEDQINYAHVELTHPDHTGSIIVWAKDLPVVKGKAITDVDAWIESELEFKDANILSTNLGDELAKKILISSPKSKLVLGTIYDNVLWYIEGTYGDSEYWKTAFETISGSFKFKPLPSAAKAATAPIEDSGADVGPVDEEEVLE